MTREIRPIRANKYQVRSNTGSTTIKQLYGCMRCCTVLHLVRSGTGSHVCTDKPSRLPHVFILQKTIICRSTPSRACTDLKDVRTVVRYVTAARRKRFKKQLGGHAWLFKYAFAKQHLHFTWLHWLGFEPCLRMFRGSEPVARVSFISFIVHIKVEVYFCGCVS